jgi:monoamine oxidase
MDVALPKPPQSAVPGTSPNMVHITSSASTPVPQNQKLPSKKPNSSRPKSMRSKKDDELLPPVGHDGPLLIPQNIPPTAATLKVCVIGAGIAGLAAAQFLHQHGINNVVVYESRLRIGGRVQSMSIDGHIVEMGAQFIQDNAANPIVDMCSQLHLRLQSLTNENAGSELLKMFTEKRDPLMREHFPDIDEQKASKAIAADNQMDLSKPLPATDLPIKPHLNAPQAPQHNSTTATDGAYPRSKYDLFMLGAAPTDLSYDMPMYTHEYSDRPAIVLDGLSELVRNMAIGLDIRLGHHVDVVNWNQDFRTDSVLLRYTDAHGQVRNESFDAVIVAVPLGVLKTQTLRFQPPLPYDKAQAIDGLRVGHQNKLILIFEEAFWSQEKMQAPTDDQTSEILTDPSATQPKRKGVVWQDESLGLMAFDCQVGTDLSTATKAAGSESFAALQVVWCGDLALTMNNLQPKECADAIVDKLAQAFSGQATPTLKGFVWVPWSADPHCLGAHSYVPRDEHPSVRLAFAEPFHCGRIGFAGEHTHMVHPSSLHGAYESGIREARRIIHSFTECPVGRLAHPFDQPVSYQTYADLPWKGADENSLATADLSGLPKVAVRLPAMEMAS